MALYGVHSKILQRLALFNSISFAALAVSLGSAEGVVSLATVLLVVALLISGNLLVVWQSLSAALRPLYTFGEIAEELNQGRVHSRIITVGLDPDLADSCWKINDLLDRLEMVVSEQHGIDQGTYPNRPRFSDALVGFNHLLSAVMGHGISLTPTATSAPRTPEATSVPSAGMPHPV